MAITDNFKTALLPLVEKLTAEADFSKIIFEKSFLPTDFNTANTIVTGVRNGNVVPIISDVPNYASFPFVDANSCDVTECDTNTNYSGKKWELGLIECRHSICLRNFDDEFLAFWNQYKMINPTTDVTEEYLNTALLQFIINKVKVDLNAAKWRAGFFGDKSATTNLLNGINGIFVQAEANAANVVPIAKNNAATFAEQRMTGKEIYDTLVAMDEIKVNQISTDPNEMIWMPRSMAQVFASYLNSNKETDCCAGVEVRLNPDNIGARAFTYQNLQFRGVPIMPVQEWDGVVNNVPFLNGGGGNNKRVQPNKILWTAKSNVLIGTQDREDLDMFEIWYDRTDRKVYIEAGAYLGAALPLNEYVLAI